MIDGAVEAAIGALPAEASSVEVLGESALAHSIRARLGARNVPDGQRPDAVVDATGDPQRIQSAMARVGDLGAIVLAAPVPRTPARLDLYADLHVRGLTLIGIAAGGTTANE